MKKALIITYAWPPKGGVGVMRILKFAKYLPQFGWTPTVITTDDTAPGSPYKGEDVNMGHSSIRVIRTGYRESLKWLPDRLKKVLLLPDTHVGWFKFALDEAKKLLEREKFDIVFSTSPPETSHLIARAIKRKFGIPWVADLRDLWSMDHFEREPFLRRAFSAEMERDVFKDADILTTVSRPWADDLLKVNRFSPDKVKVLTNGFDEEDFEEAPSEPPKKFTITYTGKLHKVMQNPEMLFKVLGECVKEGSIDRNRLEIRFYTLGFEKANVNGIASKYGISDVVRQFDGVSYTDSIKAQKNSTLLVFFQWKGSRGWYSAKIFEYLGSQKPVLVISEKDSIVNDLIRDLRAGFTAHSAGEVKGIILGCYRDYLKNGAIDCGIKKEDLKVYSRKVIAGNLSSIFNELTVKK